MEKNQEKFKLSFEVSFEYFEKTMENGALLQKSKCSILHNVLNTWYFKGVKRHYHRVKRDDLDELFKGRDDLFKN